MRALRGSPLKPPLRYCPGCGLATACYQDKTRPCATLRRKERLHEEKAKQALDQLTSIEQGFRDQLREAKEDCRIADEQNANLKKRIDELLRANTEEVEKRRDVERDILVQETIIAALADRCIIVERKLKRS